MSYGSAPEAKKGDETRERVLAHLRELVSGEVFSRSERLTNFLRYIVEQTLAGHGTELKERVIATNLYGKGEDFDSDPDPIVRVDARRLRDKLREYYAAHPSNGVVITLPKGSYTPVFENTAPQTPARTAVERRWWLTAIGFIALGGGLAWLATKSWDRPSEQRPMQFLVHVPAGLRVAALRDAGPAVLSPDGRRFAFVAAASGQAERIWIQALDTTEAKPLPGTEDGRFPFWSPDGAHIAFFASDKLKRITIASGVVQTICDAPIGRGGAWSPKGVIVFARGRAPYLLRVADSGGVPSRATSLGEDVRHTFPSFLADGSRFVYAADPKRGNRRIIRLASLDNPDGSKTLWPSASHAVASSGHLLFVSESVLTAVRLEGSTAGEPTVVADGVLVGPERAIGDFSVSENDMLLYRRNARAAAALAWYGRDGKLRSEPTGLRTDRDVSLSPDGRHVATVELSLAQPDGDLWLYDLERKTRIRLTASPEVEYTPVWSHDAEALYFTRRERDKPHLYRQPAHSADLPTHLAEWAGWLAVTDTSPDGRFVVLQGRTARGDQDLLRFDTRPGGRIEALIETPFNEAQGRISPDGRWLAYTSDESGRYEIYLRSLTQPPTRFAVSREGGVQPRWSRNGRELFFISLEGDLMAAAAPWEGRAPVKLFSTAIEASSRDATEFTQYAVSPDGKQFLLPSPSEAPAGASWILMTNWPARRR